MRFFKFLHRRTKSDSAISPPGAPWDHILNRRPQSLDAAQAAILAAAIPACPRTFLYPTPTDASNAIFELQSANAHLERELSTRTDHCRELQSHLEATRADLFTQLHQNSLLQRHIQTDRIEMDELLAKLAKYERFIGLMISVGVHQRVLGDAYTALRNGVDPDAALVDAIKDAAAVPGSPWSTIIPSVTGPRTQDEYRASLHLTLKARKELRDTRKIAKYWKQLALENAPSGIVTPSVSAISSINEPLPPDRQKAVDELISTRRRASLASQLTKPLEPHMVPIPASSSSSSTGSLPTADAPNTPVALEPVTPNQVESFAPPLSPLASESFRSQLANVSSGPRLFKRPPVKQNRPVLGQVDGNVPAPQRATLPRNKSSLRRRANSQNRFKPDDDSPTKSRPRPHELAVTKVVPSFSKHSLCSNHLGPLGRIEEEREDATPEVPQIPDTEEQDSDEELGCVATSKAGAEELESIVIDQVAGGSISAGGSEAHDGNFGGLTNAFAGVGADRLEAGEFT
ncbi:hypothetical protein MKEN_01178500 [Mycena kentingensis (nom. inval.)]|nr:hypothetical protein MKEN_01178500 [Mycena kentingensis (nom. inval.)]